MKEQKVVEMHFEGQGEQVSRVRRLIRGIMASQGLSPGCTEDVVLALQEAIVNVVRHAYRGDEHGRMNLKIRRAGDNWRFRLADFAPTNYDNEFKSRDLNDIRPGGLGVFIIDQVMDRVEFIPPDVGEGNVLEMTKTLSETIQH